MSGRFDNIQALRGAAVLMIVLIHFHGAEKEYAGAGRVMAGNPDLAFSAIDLFFLFSGFVLMRAGLNQSGSFRDGLKFLCKRAFRVYPVYWVVMVVFMVLFVGNWLVFGEPVEVPNLLADLLLIPTGERPFLLVSWTLSHEIYFYFVFSLFLLAGRRAILPLLMAWGGLVVIAAVAGWRDLSSVTGVLFHPLTFDFIAGCLVAFLVYAGMRRFGVATFAGGIVWLAGLGIYRVWFGGAELAEVAGGWNLALNYGVPATLVLYGAAVLEIKHKMKAPHWLVAVGDRSYTLYLIHVPIIMVFGKGLPFLARDAVWDSLVFFAIWAAGIAVATWAFYRFVEMPIGKWSNRFLDRQFEQRLPERAGVTVSRTV